MERSDAKHGLSTELQALQNAHLGLDPLLVAIETHDRVGAAEIVQQLIDIHITGATLDDQERGYVLMPWFLLTANQRQMMALVGVRAFTNAAD